MARNSHSSRFSITMRLLLTQQIFHVGRVKLGIFPLGTASVLYVVRTQFESDLKHLSSDDSVEGANRFHFCVVRTNLKKHIFGLCNSELNTCIAGNLP